MSSLPAGTIIAFGGSANTTPVGWLLCDGSIIQVEQYPELYQVIGRNYGGDNTTFNVPDLRGQFLRGADLGSGNDPDASSRLASAPGGATGNQVGSKQADEFRSHTHDYIMFPGQEGGIASGQYWAQRDAQTGAAGGSETRPTNVYVNFIIKANNN